MTTFKSSLGICGLSQQGAAVYLDVSLASVKDWCRGKSAPPLGVWQMMADLLRRIEAAADHTSAMIDIDEMDRRTMNGIDADSGDDPLPSGADSAAGAMALLMAISDRDHEN